MVVTIFSIPSYQNQNSKVKTPTLKELTKSILPQKIFAVDAVERVLPLAASVVCGERAVFCSWCILQKDATVLDLNPNNS